MHVKKSAIQAIVTDLEIEQRCNEYMEKEMTERVEKTEASLKIKQAQPN